MGTVLRTELSKRNEYFISKHRRLELVHFCLQYDEWDKKIKEITIYPSANLNRINTSNREIRDTTSDTAIKVNELTMYMKLVKETCYEADDSIGYWIFLGVTKGYSFETLKASYLIPCERSMYYNRYKKFFYLLDKKR